MNAQYMTSRPSQRLAKMKPLSVRKSETPVWPSSKILNAKKSGVASNGMRPGRWKTCHPNTRRTATNLRWSRRGMYVAVLDCMGGGLEANPKRRSYDRRPHRWQRKPSPATKLDHRRYQSHAQADRCSNDHDPGEPRSDPERAARLRVRKPPCAAHVRARRESRNPYRGLEFPRGAANSARYAPRRE